MDEQTLDNLISESQAYIDKQKAHCEQFYQLGQFHRMDYEQESCKMVFSDIDSIPKIVAEFQIIGSLSARSNTWLWAWDNPYLLDNTTQAVHELKKYGEKNDIGRLKDSKWEAEEKDAWEMTAVAAFILKACGAYSFPSDDIRVYAIFTNIKWIGSVGNKADPSTGDVE